MLETDNNATNYIHVGITGHRDLLENEIEFIRLKLIEKFKELRNKSQKRIKLYSALAPGADLLAAQYLDFTKGDELIIIQSLPENIDLEYTFKGYEDQKAAFLAFREPSKATEIRDLMSESDKRKNYHSEKVRNEQYVKVGEFLAQNCEHLIALWDGVDGGGIGGTSDVVRMWVKEKGLNGVRVKSEVKNRKLHQLIVSRSKNKFPIGRNFSNQNTDFLTPSKLNWIEFENPQKKDIPYIQKFKNFFNQYIGWFLTGFLFFGSVLFNNVTNNNPEEDYFAASLLLVAFIIAWVFYHIYSSGKDLLLRFVFPFLLAVGVLILGTVGFMMISCTAKFSNSFFSAANLITLNASEFKEIPNPNVYLKTARVLGGFLAAYTFLLAFALATGKENLSKLFFFLRRKLGLPFYVIFADGVKGYDLLLDLLEKDKKVVYLDGSDDDYWLSLIEDKNCYYIKGKAFSSKSLQKTYFWQAEEVFVMNENDESNFRAIQEMDELEIDKKADKSSHIPWYVNIESLHTRERVHNLLARRSPSLHTFGVASNTARRLLLKHPIDRFSDSVADTCQVIIFGFNEKSKALVLACLNSGHYLANKKLRIQIFYKPSEQPFVESFKQEYPQFWINASNQTFNNDYIKVRNYTFKIRNGFDKPISFHTLPSGEYELRNSNFELYNFIKPENCVSLYTFLDDGIENSNLLSAVLPRIQFLKLQNSINIQVFVYYNYPDKDEQEYIETRLNSLASYIPLFCFGNYLDECSHEAIKNEDEKLLSKKIALLYNCLFDNEGDISEFHRQKVLAIRDKYKQLSNQDYNQAKVKETKELLAYWQNLDKKEYHDWLDSFWMQMKEIDRESNMLAADHSWVKFREMGIGFKNQVFEWSEQELKLLSELEHRRWNAEKILLGWQIYDGTNETWKKQKDDLKLQKIHNYLVTWMNLAISERTKDWAQVIGVKGFVFEENNKAV